MPLKIHRDELPTLNLTSMVDVLFLLIVFFMVGTEFTELERKIALQVPRVADVKSLAPAPKQRVISVHRDGRITLDRSDVSLDQLVARLQAAQREHHDLGVLVRGDAEGPFQNVASVLNACRQAGISQLGISVRLAQQPESPLHR